MRKLQTIGKASGRVGTTLPGTRTSGSGTFSTLEFQLQQQSQTAVFRPAKIELWTASIKSQKQRAKASTWCSTAEYTSRESDSLCSIAPRILSSLWLRYQKSCTNRASGQSANRSSRRNPVGSSRISPSCCYLPSLSGQYHSQNSTRVFCRSCWFKAGGFYQHSETRLSHERSSNSKIAVNAIWANSEDIRRNYRKCRIWHFSCRSFGLSRSSRPDTEINFNLDRRNRLVSAGNQTLVMGSRVRRTESVSAVVKSEQQGTETSTWQLLWLSYIRSVGELLDISSSEKATLLEPSDTRFSEGLRSRSRSQKTWCMGRQRAEKSDEALESLPHWTNFTKTAESGDEANTQQIQDFGEMRASIRRQIYGCSLQKPQKKMDCSMDFRKISTKSRADKQSGGEGFAKACYLAKNFTGQQVSEWDDFCSEINDCYYFSWPAGPECNGIYRNNAQKFPGGISTAKTELKYRCLNQQNHSAYSAVENQKIFEQSNTYTKNRSCGSATT